MLVKKNADGYGYKYSDLAQITKLLAENNMDYYQYTESTETGDYIMTVIITDGKESAPRRGCKIVNATLERKSNPVQEYGSALTYARRYSLMMACGLATTDDDAACFDKPKMASNSDKNAFIKACEIAGEDYKKILKQAGFSGGDCTEETLDKAKIILKEISDGKGN